MGSLIILYGVWYMVWVWGIWYGYIIWYEMGMVLYGMGITWCGYGMGYGIWYGMINTVLVWDYMVWYGWGMGYMGNMGYHVKFNGN